MVSSLASSFLRGDRDTLLHGAVGLIAPAHVLQLRRENAREGVLLLLRDLVQVPDAQQLLQLVVLDLQLLPLTSLTSYFQVQLRHALQSLQHPLVLLLELLDHLSLVQLVMLQKAISATLVHPLVNHRPYLTSPPIGTPSPRRCTSVSTRRDSPTRKASFFILKLNLALIFL